MKKAAIFDMDGTLVANSPVHIRAFEIFCARYGVTDWREKLANGFGMGNDDIMRLVMPEEVIREKGLAALADEKEAIYREIYAPDIRPVEGLKELLERLRAAGIPCAVGSSGCKANVDFVLDSCAIRPYFDAAISGDMVSRCKPDPEIYLTAAAALGVEAARIAKTLAFKTKEGGGFLVVAAGDARIDGGKFKKAFGVKPRMLSFDEVEPLTGHAPGGVTPFGRTPGLPCWIDVSIERFSTVFPAVGDAASAIELTPEELERAAQASGRVDVCRIPESVKTDQGAQGGGR